MVNKFLFKNLRIAVFTHTQYINHCSVHGPSDILVDFLKKNIPGIIFYVKHSIYRGDGSFLETYDNGQRKSIKANDLSKNLPNIFRYVIDFFSTFLWFILDKSLHLIIAVDPLNFLYAYIIKRVKKTNKLIYYTVDYSYRRFRNPLLNKIYHRLDLFAVKRANLLWNSCRKIKDVRDRQLEDIKENIYLSNIPIVSEVKIKNENEIDKFSLVNIFSNHKHVDYDIMFKALSCLIKYYPQISLKLIGRGDFEKEIVRNIKDEQIKAHIKFMDISSHIEALEEISRSGIGLECNTQTVSWNEFREPLKIMEYITFGLPIISKPGHGLVSEIVDNKIGFIVKNDKEFFNMVFSLLSNSQLYREIRNNVLNFAHKIDKEKIISESLNELLSS